MIHFDKVPCTPMSQTSLTMASDKEVIREIPRFC